MRIRKVFHYFRRFIYLICKYFILLIPKNDKLIVFSAWFGRKYADSSMYMYEYMLNKPNYKVVWFTRDKEIYLNLKKKGAPVILSGSVKSSWTLMRAKMLVSSVQFSDFPHQYLSNCIYYDLDHGFQLKEGPLQTKEALSYTRFLRKKIDYYYSASSFFCMSKVSNYFDVVPSRIALVNKPRTDVLFDDKLREGKNTIIDAYKNGKKAIVWMPTHRSDGKVSIDVKKLLDLEKIQKICEEINAVFLIKKHYYHKHEKVDLKAYSRIFDITNDDVETQTLLYQADVLISDYSSAYIDYLLLDRPIILYVYDLEEYLSKERNIFVPFHENHVGSMVNNPLDLNNILLDVCSDWKDTEHSIGRKEMRNKFFSEKLRIGHAREEVFEVIKQLLNGSFEINWDSIRS